MQERLSMPMGEAMFTQRAIRRLKPDRIPDEDLHTIIEAAVKAPNGANRQPGRFLVLTDPEVIHKVGVLYHEAWWAKRKDEFGWNGPEDLPEDEKHFRMPALLADEIRNAPAIVLAFSTVKGQASSVLPSCQNLMLAARALGIGSVLTTLHGSVMERLFALLQVPKDAECLHCIPLGYPRGNFGPNTRMPTAETTYWNSWGTPPPWA